MEYVRITIKTNAGNKTFWAEVIQRGQKVHKYKVVDKEGDTSDKMHYLIVAPEDIVSEKPAKMNLHYGELEMNKRDRTIVLSPAHYNVTPGKFRPSVFRRFGVGLGIGAMLGGYAGYKLGRKKNKKLKKSFNPNARRSFRVDHKVDTSKYKIPKILATSINSEKEFVKKLTDISDKLLEMWETPSHKLGGWNQFKNELTRMRSRLKNVNDEIVAYERAGAIVSHGVYDVIDGMEIRIDFMLKRIREDEEELKTKKCDTIVLTDIHKSGFFCPYCSATLILKNPMDDAVHCKCGRNFNIIYKYMMHPKDKHVGMDLDPFDEFEKIALVPMVDRLRVAGVAHRGFDKFREWWYRKKNKKEAAPEASRATST